MIHFHKYEKKTVPNDLTKDTSIYYTESHSKLYPKFVIPIGQEYKQCSICGKIKKIKV